MNRSVGLRLGILPLVLLIVAVIAGGVGVRATSAVTYYGGNFSTSPNTITAGTSTNIVLSTQSSPTFDFGGGNIFNCGTSCSFTLEACTAASFMYYSIHQIRVVSPSGAQYALGSGLSGGTYDLTYPQSIGGPSSGGVSTQTTANGFGPALNVSASDTLSVPFGAGTGVPFTLTTSIGTGTYSWFPVTGTSATASPTSEVGTYNIDVEGQVLCGTTHIEFDVAQLIFTTTSTTSPGNAFMFSTSSCDDADLLPVTTSGAFILPPSGQSVWIQIRDVTQVPVGTNIYILLHYTTPDLVTHTAVFPTSVTSKPKVNGGVPSSGCEGWKVGDFSDIKHVTILACTSGTIAFSDRLYSNIYQTGTHFYGNGTPQNLAGC